eukprot:TRINITY_DN8798_c0_g1_i1.p1 TRINITY_DN8798_c0_g1~~TRINITY_DN8798_c0_g1_i1.p1  ORF type:complete len:1347 (+),score=353.90 TRINITY_DN8798_c0_g1_i1:25-4041(+)
MRFFRQSRVLLKKNFLLLWRNKTSSFLQVFIPILFMTLLVLLQFILSEDQKQDPAIKELLETVDEEIGNIAPCVVGEDRDSCFTIGYSPSGDPNVGLLIEKIQEYNDIEDDKVISFITETDANVYMNENPNSTQAVYHVLIDYGCDQLPTVQAESCYSSSHSVEDVIGVKYIIQYNLTGTYFRGVFVDKNALYVMPMQISMDRASMEVFTESAVNLDISTSEFPHPQLAPVDIIGTLGPIFIFGALMFNFVIQMGNLVREKQKHLRESMRVMGLIESAFWITWFITNLIMNTFSILLLIATGAVFQLNFFLKNDFLTFFFLFFLFALSMVTMVFFFSTLVNDSTQATILGFLIYLIGILVQGATTLIYGESTDDIIIYLFNLLPFVLLAKGLGDLGSQSQNSDSVGLRFSQINDSDLYFFPLQDVYIWLIVDTLIFLVLALYLDNVIYDEQPLWFFLKPSYWCNVKSHTEKKEDSDLEYVRTQIDSDVANEIDMIDSGNYPDRVAVVLKNIKKTFKGSILGCIPDKKNDFKAVRGVYLALDEGSLLCLLGHNGAGKTTTIKMLTGLLPVTSGSASIFGYSVIDDMSDIRSFMGVCPQHDILWKQLKAREHLELFSEIKGVPSHLVEGEIEQRLDDVDLLKNADEYAGGFSGGMQRRLSVAIALVGDPKIVYLDEPTTGMDPVSRRKVWNLIENVKRGRVTLLTTHSMEEADILGDRIAIMKEGYIVAVGTSLHLKNKYGSGYNINVVSTTDKVKSIKKIIKNHFKVKKGENGIRFINEEMSKSGVVNFTVPPTLSDPLPDFFQILEDQKEDLNIIDFQIRLATLEEVFLEVAAEDNVGESVQSIKKKKKKPFLLKLIPFTLILLVILFAVGSQVLPGGYSPITEVAPSRAEEPEPFSTFTLDDTNFAWGIQVGIVDQTSAKISFRSLLDTVDIVVFSADENQWVEESDFEQLSFSLSLLHGSVYYGNITLTGLQPNTAYTLLLTGEDSDSGIASKFRTATDITRKIRFGASGGFGQTNTPWETLTRASEQNLDFFILAGDLVYTEELSDIAKDDFEEKYTTSFAVQGLYDLLQTTNVYAVWNSYETGQFSFSEELSTNSNSTTYNPFQSEETIRQRYADAYDAFNEAYGRDENYQKISIGNNSIDLFILDTVSERTLDRIMSVEQMDWFKDELLASEATFKIIVHSSPISDISDISFSLQQTLFYTWNTYGVQRQEIIDFIDEEDIPGIMWISGGLEMAGLYTNISSNNISSYAQFEIFVGPAGSRINPNVRFQPFLFGDNFRFGIDTWTYTLFECDPITSIIDISFLDDEDNEIEFFSIDVSRIDLAFEEDPPPFFL